MTDSTINHSKRESVETQADSGLNWRKGPQPEEIVELRTREEAQKDFGLTRYQLAMGLRRKQLRVYRMGGKGRLYYAQDQLQRLADHLAGRKSSDDYTFSWNAA